MDILTENVRLMFGDCLERLKEVEAGSVDMVLCDPPYGMDLTVQRKGSPFSGAKIKNDDHLTWSDSFFKECRRVIKKNCSAMFFCSHHCVAEFILSARAAGFEIKSVLVWDKMNFGIGGAWRPQHEFILFCSTGRAVTKANNNRSIISGYKRVHHSRAVHPTEKPVDLLLHLIFEIDTDPEVILDPFMGSGSTGVASRLLGRKFIGIELDPNYYGVACGRVLGAL